MTTILILNAASSLVAAVGVGGWLAHRGRRARTAAAPQPVYVDAGRTRRYPSR